jgi:hypothetical protein
MKFYVMARTYNTYGGDPTLSLISDFLVGNAEDFGSALSELTVTFHFPHTGRARRTLEQMFADFPANRRSQPKVVFRRKRGQASIDIASELVDGKDCEQRCALSLPLFEAGVGETVAALELMRRPLHWPMRNSSFGQIANRLLPSWPAARSSDNARKPLKR